MALKHYLQTQYGRREAALLSGLLLVDLVLGVTIAHNLPFQAPNPSYLCDAVQLAATHRIASVFLPVGYSALLGLSDVLGGATGMTALSIFLQLCVIAAAWIYLRSFGISTRATLVLATLLSLYPDFLLSYTKAQDTALTAVLLFAFVLLLLRASTEERLGWFDLLLGLTLGYAVMVRPNLALLVPVVWLVYWKFRVPCALWRLASQLAILAVVYAAGTAAAHGRPFLPQNGPYNLYSGANEFTAEHIANEESSLIQALAAHGIAAVDPPVLCIQDSPDPSHPDIHERRLDPLYSRFALQFMRDHPAAMARLVWKKLVTLLSPDFQVHSPRSVGGLFKIVAALAFPLWVVAMLVRPHPGPRAARFVVVTTVAAYVMPFLLTVSSSRFRVPLDFFLWIDLGAIVCARYFAPPARPAR